MVRDLEVITVVIQMMSKMKTDVIEKTRVVNKST